MTAALIAIIAFAAVDFMRPVQLTVPALGIEVACRRVLIPTSEHLQSVIDQPDTAAWYDCYIMDHAGENFCGLWNIQPGDAVFLGERQYYCSFLTTGWSECGIRPKDGQLPAADLYLCTCKPYGEEYEIYIVGVDKEK